MSADRPQIAALYDAHGAALAAFALNLTRCEADARDVVQETFCRLAREPGLLGKMNNHRAFLFTMAYRQVIDLQRRHAVRERYATEPVELFAPVSNPDETHFREAVAEAMAVLPTDQRAVIHLKLWEAQTFEQIAGTLGIPPNTAASRYRYGIDKLRTLLRPVYEEML
jgi:RNA polymerase sigma-70 factor (ECF subfamily)